MAWGSHSQRNIPPSTVVFSELEQPISPEGTPSTSDMGLPDVSAQDAPILAPPSTNELFKQFMKAYLEAKTPALV